MGLPRPSPPRLLVTGDDFGSSTRVNEAVERDHEQGWLRHAGLIVTGPALAEALRIAQRCPALTVGLHLTLCAGQAVEPRRHLTDRAGAFPRHPGWAGLRYAFDPRVREALTAEVEAQFARFRDLGLCPAGWDGHGHLHLHPKVFPRAVRAARGEFRYVRLVRSKPARTPLEKVFNGLSALAARSLAADLVVTTPEQTFGLRDTGRLGTADLLAAVAAVRPGELAELYYHPGEEQRPLDIGRALATAQARGVLLVGAGRGDCA